MNSVSLVIPDTNPRKITFPSDAFGILRKELILNIGLDRMKGFLTRYGWNLGVSDAKEILKDDLSIEEMVLKGPVFHHSNGHIDGLEIEDFEVENQTSLTTFKCKGAWLKSYEAIEHVKQFGYSKEPVCHTLVGYASGYLSTVLGQKVIGKEVNCVGKGDPKCTWEIRLFHNWKNGTAIKKELAYYSNESIVKELELTYMEMFEQKNYIKKLADFHRQLTDSISNGSDLESICNIAHSSTGIPVTIEDVDFTNLVYSGLQEEEYEEINEDFKRYLTEKIELQSNHRLSRHFLNKQTIESSLQKRLMVPIIVQKKIMGYCTFIFTGDEIANDSQYIEFLERIANAASLILLNEKTSFETMERMKGTFLEQILGDEMSKSEIKKRGNFIGVNFDKPYFIISLGYLSDGNVLELQNNIIKLSAAYFKANEIDALVGHKEGNVVVLVSKESINKKTVSNFIYLFFNYLETQISNVKIKIGISQIKKSIDNIHSLYEESIVALRMRSDDRICFFDDIGIVGLLINESNVSVIKSLAKQELGDLIQSSKPMDQELVKTLYIFLQNGGKLEQTMEDLSLSMSGLLYRVKRIESMIGKDLRNPTQAYHLLVILESLIAIGEIEI